MLYPAAFGFGALAPHLLRSVVMVGAWIVLAVGFRAAGAEPPLRVTLVGQALVKYDPRVVVPGDFATIRSLLTGGDAVFTNLEAVIAGPGLGEPTREAVTLHRAEPAVLEGLAAAGFNLFAVSNNHAWDFNAGGILSTLAALESRHLAHAGTGRSLREAAAPGILRTPHGRVALVAMASGKVREGGAATDGRPGVNEVRLDEKLQRIQPADAARVLAEVRTAAGAAECVIVYQHNHYWEEPMTKTPAWMQRWARECLDAGASVFVAHGTPMMHGVEIYRGRPIFYGLGNFIFQPALQDRWNEAASWESVVAECEFSGGVLRSLRLRPLVLNAEGVPGERFVETRGWPKPAAPGQGASILGRVASLSEPYGTRFTLDAESATVLLFPPAL